MIFCQTDEFEDPSVAFQIIEDVPVFPGCEGIEMDKRRKCLQEKIVEHIIKNFRYPKKARKNNITGKVHVSFIVEKDGSIKVAYTNGPHELLENEAKRIIELLPKMRPGQIEGEPVRMTMSIPINFTLTK